MALLTNRANKDQLPNTKQCEAKQTKPNQKKTHMFSSNATVTDCNVMYIQTHKQPIRSKTTKADQLCEAKGATVLAHDSQLLAI